MLNRVQNKFLKYAGHILKIEHPPHNYLPVLEEDRRRAAYQN